jgi:hypothetical protein
MRGSAGPVLDDEAESGASEHMVVSELSKPRGGVQNLGHVTAPEPSLCREVGSDTTVARGSA